MIRVGSGIIRVDTGKASGVIRGALQYPGKINFPSRMKNDPYSLLEGTVFLREASEYIRHDPGLSNPENAGGYTEGIRCLPGVVRIIFHPCTPGRKIVQV